MNSQPQITCCTAEQHLEILLNRSILEPSGCWTWTGALTPDGYGSIRHSGKPSRGVHRFAYYAVMGPIPAGLVIDHLCRNRACVNPEHLEVVTSRENTMRGATVTAYNSRKIACPKGHQSYRALTTTGDRWCPDCIRDEKRARRSRNAQSRPATDDPRHGTTTGYTELQCRCNPCRTARAEYAKAHPAPRKVHPRPGYYMQDVCKAGLHDLTAPGAVLIEGPRIRRCAACRQISLQRRRTAS